MKTTLAAWKIETVSRFDFRLDDVALRALLGFTDEHPVMMAFIGLALMSVADLCTEKEQPA